MPVRYLKDTAMLEGVCTIEEAGDLADWLRDTSDAGVDLSGCRHLHTAVLQALLALRPRLVAGPTDPHLRERLLPLLGDDGNRPRADGRADEDRPLATTAV